jgi:hypothetical protein
MKLAVLSLALLLLPIHAQSPATLPISDIRPGMKGYGKTVFHGGKIERFDFEVVGIQRNASPGRGLIMVKASGGPLAETGILEGMSGSPCYIDGKLIGALSTASSSRRTQLPASRPLETCSSS